MFPRFKYSDIEKFKDALFYLQIYLTNDVIKIIKLHFQTYIENDLIIHHYFNIEKRWKKLENLNQTTLELQYLNIPENERIVLFHEKNYNNTHLTEFQKLKNRYFMIESISSYERKRIKLHVFRRTKSYSNITAKTNIYQKYKKIWENDEIYLSNLLIEFQIKGYIIPSLYYWPDYTKHVDEKNKEIARNFISSIIRPRKNSIRRRLVHEI